MELNVSLVDGGILVRQDRRDAPVRFAAEAEAVAHLAYHVAHKARRIGMDASCASPGRHGRPGFDAVTFQRKVDAEVRRIQFSLNSMAA